MNKPNIGRVDIILRAASKCTLVPILGANSLIVTGTSMALTQAYSGNEQQLSRHGNSLKAQIERPRDYW